MYGSDKRLDLTPRDGHARRDAHRCCKVRTETGLVAFAARAI